MTESWHYRCADVCVLPHIGQRPWKADFPRITNRTHEESEIEYEGSEIEYEGYDGWYNNRAHPDWGGVGMSIFLIPFTPRLLRDIRETCLTNKASFFVLETKINKTQLYLKRVFKHWELPFLIEMPC